MISTLVMFFFNYKRYILISLLLIPLMGLLYTWKKNYDETILQEFIIEEQKRVIEQQKAQNEINQVVIKSLNKIKEVEKKSSSQLKRKLKDIHNAPKTDDGPVAPVLRRSIDKLYDN